MKVRKRIVDGEKSKERKRKGKEGKCMGLDRKRRGQEMKERKRGKELKRK